MRPKILFPITAAIMIIGIVCSVVVRSSYTNKSMDDIMKYDFSAGSDITYIIDGDTELGQIDNFDDVIASSDAVILATFSGERKFIQDLFYTSIHVEKVLEGKVTSNELVLLEPVTIMNPSESNPNGILATIDEGVVPVKENHRYILAINKMEYEPARNLNNHYYLSTNSILSMYDLDLEQKRLLSSETSEPVTKLTDIEMCTTEQKQLDIYHNFKKQAIKKYQDQVS